VETRRRQRELPDSKRLQEALSKVGFEQVKIDQANQTVELTAAEMRLDLGGIAKGYAIDRAMDALKSRGITAALIDGSGDVLVSAAPPGACGWKIGIAALTSPEGEPTEFLSLAHTAIATSGDAYQFVELDGKRYSHLVDPRTGLGLTEQSSVSVIAPDCTTADAWASAVSVLGPERGLLLIEREQRLAALVRTLAGAEESIRRSCRFPPPAP
jgi:FAD:protein FMN transferase